MSLEQRTCPYCPEPMWPDRDTCPNCQKPYPAEARGEDPATNLPPTGRLSPRAARGGAAGGAGGPQGPGGPRGGFLAALAPHKTVLMLVGVLVLIVLVGFALLQFGLSLLAQGRPDPSTLPTSTPGPVVVPPTLAANGSPVAGASPSPGAGTVIAPAASPSPAASGVRLKVANTEGQGANMRQRPSTTAPVLRTLPDNTVVEAIGGETNAEGRSWRNVRDPNGQTGWIASEFLVPE
jgi:hypothetical protein